MVKIFVAVLLTVLAACGGQRALASEPGVGLTLNPDPPPPNESFSLVFEARGDVDADPDFKPLERDFEILGRKQQTSLQIVDGRRARSTVWVLDVLPKHGAPLTVPAISFGRYSTTPREIVFAPAGGAAQADDDGLFLEVDASPMSPYVQQQVIYRLRLWRRYEISNASLSEPTLSADAIVKPLDEDRSYEADRDGKRYEVIERRFAIFPQASGKVTIQPAVVTAQVVKRGFSLFDSFSQPVATKRVVSDAVALDVKPIPADFPGGTWLPARQLSLHEEWLPAPPVAKVGEPLTRTLNLWADGLTAGQLPPIEMSQVAGLKLYPDRPQTSEQQTASGYSAVLQRKTALIPDRAGRIEVPPIEIRWWNTTTDRLELARLPATSLTSEAVPGLAPAPPAPAVTESPAQGATATTEATPPGNAAADEAATGFWPALALVACAGWLLTLVLWWRRPAAHPTPATVAGSAAAHDHRGVAAGFASGDPRRVAEALLDWARLRWPEHPPRSLGALATRVDPAFAAALWALDGALYRPGAGEVDLPLLEQCWQAARAAAGRAQHEPRSPLPALYPSHARNVNHFTN